MADKKISQLTAKGSAIAANDLIEASVYISPGVYSTRSVRGDELGGVSAFTELTDVPASYTGQTLKYIRVNAGETALEFVNAPTASTGRFGIADSNGAYTYYTTLTLAMAAATSGQTIEMFTDYTETGAVSITLKNGVTINGNGHTYTVTNATVNLELFVLASGATSNLFNLIVDYTGGVAGVNLATTTGTVNCDGSIFKRNAGTVVYTSGATFINNINVIGTATAAGIGNQGGTITNAAVSVVNGIGINNISGTPTRNSRVRTTGTGVGLQGANFVNCTAVASGSGLACYFTGSSSSINAVASAAGAIEFGTGVYSDIVAISTGSYAVGVYYNNVKISNFRFESTAGIAVDANFSTSGTFLSNGVIESSAARVYNGTSSNETYANVTFRCTWNDAGGHAYQANANDNLLVNCTLEVANASANCIYSSAARTVKYSNNAFKGATTAVNANVTQGVSNTHDSQGNILI